METSTTEETTAPAGDTPLPATKPPLVEGPAYQISQEHCYSKLGPFRSNPAAGFFPTEVLFPSLLRETAALHMEEDGRDEGGRKREEEEGRGVTCEDQVQVVRKDSDKACEKGKESDEKEEEEEEEGDIDVVGVEPLRSLPYDEVRVGLIMMECVKHLNLVKVPPENGDLLLEKVLLECGFQQRRLLSTLLRILQGDHLARLTCQQVIHEPIKRRLHNDRAVRQFRKALSDVNWDPKLVSWAHETLIQLLDSDLLPVYLDILQILKSKCPVLVEQMVHSSLGLVGGEAFSLLLKRPWNPVVGMTPVDRLAHFDNPPLFVTLPHSSVGLGGRRWRLWQSQLSSIGKVYPVIMPEVLSEPGQARGLVEFTEIMLTLSLARVQELNHQFPTRPIVLLAWTVAGRIAAKIAEVAPISCIVSLGLPAGGLHHTWQVSTDPFTQCKTPTVFAVGSKGTLTSVDYVEHLRTALPAPNALIVVGGADDLNSSGLAAGYDSLKPQDMLRLSPQDKYSEEVCQSIADRCVLEKVYKFMVYNLSTSFPEESKPIRKRKSLHNEEIGASFLTPAVSHSSIILNPHSDNPSWNCNLNNSNAFLKSFLSMRQSSRGSLYSHSPSPVPFDMQGDADGPPLAKMPLVGDLPKIGRPRSKSTATERPRKRVTVHSRSKSIEHSSLRAPTPGAAGSATFTCIPVDSKLNSNTNNNSTESSPTQLLSISYTRFRPLPITPPRNPYEDSGQKLNPKTLKQLQRN